MAPESKGKGAFRFLDLAGEIRVKIYRHLLVLPSLPITNIAHNKSGFAVIDNECGCLEPQILRVCQLVSSEALPILYGENAFTCIDYVVFRLFLRSLRPAYSGMIRHIAFHHGCVNWGDKPYDFQLSTRTGGDNNDFCVGLHEVVLPSLKRLEGRFYYIAVGEPQRAGGSDSFEERNSYAEKLRFDGKVRQLQQLQAALSGSPRVLQGGDKLEMAPDLTVKIILTNALIDPVFIRDRDAFGWDVSDPLKGSTKEQIVRCCDVSVTTRDAPPALYGGVEMLKVDLEADYCRSLRTAEAGAANRQPRQREGKQVSGTFVELAP